MTDVQGVVQAAKAAAGDLADQARETGGSLLSEAGKLGGTLRQGLEGQAEQQKDHIAQRIGALAERLQRSANEMQGSEAWLAALMERGARELGGVAKDMERSDVAGILGSAEVFARRQPALFVGAAVALGFALTRVARSGQDPRDEADYSRQPMTPVGVRRNVPGAAGANAFRGADM